MQLMTALFKKTGFSEAAKSPYTTPRVLLANLFLIVFNILVTASFYAIVGIPNKVGFLNWVLILIVSFNIFSALLFPIIRLVKLYGDSMLPTMKDGDYTINESITKLLNLPYKRGDIVGFLAQDPDNPVTCILTQKRIVALPGETVAVKEGRLFVDGELIEEKWNTRQRLDYDLQIYADLGKVERIGMAAAEPIVVPPEHYFVMGDNRRMKEDLVNYDSRFLGFIPVEHIHEKVLFLFYM